ncbi:hypothetical protein Fmac_010786 [Flemingia macrophylla]|uniref:Uncharacterized protein n=1 Tax=Flemingia macrophylla TaxID=520843 RepID=A0ABD1MKL1_9FABA
MNTDSLEPNWLEGSQLMPQAPHYKVLHYNEGMVLGTGCPCSSSHQALKDLRAHRKIPSKQVHSCFRAIPPSKSNPTQNK